MQIFPQGPQALQEETPERQERAATRRGSGLLRRGFSGFLAILLILNCVQIPALASQADESENDPELIAFVENLLNSGDATVCYDDGRVVTIDREERLANEMPETASVVLTDAAAASAADGAAPEEQPVAEPEQPAAEPEQPTAEPEQSAAEPEQSATEPEQPTAEPEQSAAEPEQPTAGMQTADARQTEGNDLRSELQQTADAEEAENEPEIALHAKKPKVNLWKESKVYEASSDGAKARDQYYAEGKVKKTYKKGDLITLVGDVDNLKGNIFDVHTWYKTSDGYWIYKDHVRKHEHSWSAKQQSGVTYQDKNNTKHVKTIKYKVRDCRCGATQKVDNATSTENHDWNSVGKCTLCGHKFTFGDLTKKETGNYLALVDYTLRQEPYEASAAAGQMRKGDLVEVVGYANNAFGNKWYKLSNGAWIYSSSGTQRIRKHDHDKVEDSETGVCSCGQLLSFTASSIKQEQVEIKTATAERARPFSKAAVSGNLPVGQVVTIQAKQVFSRGFLGLASVTWYQTTNGGWIKSDTMKDHTHTWEAGFCKNPGCGEKFPLKKTEVKKGNDPKKDGRLYETFGMNRVVRVAPYSNRAVKRTIPEDGTVIQVKAWAINSVGGSHKWFETADGGWIYHDNIKPHEHKIVSGRCKSPGCGYAHELKPTAVAKTQYQFNERAKAYSLPYSDSEVIATYNKNNVVTVDAQFDNYYGNRWFRLSDKTWVYSSYLEKHTHQFEKGQCKLCSALQDLPLTGMSVTTYTTKKANVSIMSRPYAGTPVIRTLASKGSPVIVVGSVKNDAKHIWYKTADDGWVYSENVEKLKAASSGNGKTILSTEFEIRVTNRKGQPIGGATVSFKGASFSTDTESGAVRLPYSKGAGTLTVSANGYTTHSESLSMEKVSGRIKTVLLPEYAAEGKTVITKATLLHSKNTLVDILHTEQTVNQAKTGYGSNFDIAIECSGTNAQRYLLVQNGKTIRTSQNGRFSDLTASEFSTGKAVYAEVYDGAGNKLASEKLMLNIIHTNTEFPANMSLSGKNAKFSAGNDAPYPFNTMSMSVIMPDLPITFDFSGEHIRAGVNFKIADEDGWKSLKSITVDKFKNYFKREALSKPNTKVFSVGLNVGGYAEGVSDKLTGKIFVEFSFSAQKEFNIPNPIVPLVGEISFQAKLTGACTFTVTYVKAKYNWDWNLDASVAFTLGAYIGVGVAYFISAGIYGKGTLTINLSILPEPYFKDVFVTGEFGLKVKIFGHNACELKIIDLDDYYLYRRTPTLNEAGSGAPNGLMDLLSDESRFVSMDRSYLDDRSGWYPSPTRLMDEETEGAVVSDFDFTTLQSSAYTDIRPQVVATDRTIMMLYADDNAQRAADDRCMLVYSLYDDGTETWSEPKPVLDDGTADFDFQAYSTGEDIYLVWQNANETLDPELSLTEIGQRTDLMIAKYSAAMDEFEDVERVTQENETYELMPRVATVNGQTIVAWYENSENNVFGISGENTVCYAVKVTDEYSEPTVEIDDSAIAPVGTEMPDDVDPIEDSSTTPEPEPEPEPQPWIRQTVAGAQPMITSLSAGYLSEDGYIAFTTDADGDMATADDQLVKLISVDDPQIVDYTDQAMNVEFTKVHGDNAITWYNQGYIYYALDAGSAPQMLYAECPIPATEYHIISSGAGDMAVLYAIKGDEQSDAYVVLYDNETMTWGLPAQITKQDRYVENFNGAYCGDVIATVFNRRSVSNEDLSEVNDLCSTLIGRRYDLQIENVIFDDVDLEPGMECPVTVELKNNGTIRTGEIQVRVIHGEDVVDEQTVTATLRPGETASVDTMIVMPEEIEPTTYLVTVEQEGANDADPTNNSRELEVGKALMKLETQQTVMEDRNFVDFTVTNTGYIPCGGTIVLYDEDGEAVDTVLYENIEDLEHGETFTGTLEFTKEDFNGEMYKIVTLGILPTQQQDTDQYNKVSILLRAAVVPEKQDIVVNEVDLDTPAGDGIELMDAEGKTVAGTVRNMTESDVDGAKVCVSAYDSRGVFLGTQFTEVTLGAGETADFTVEFPAEFEIDAVKVMLLNDENMQCLADVVEITMQDYSDEETVIDEELYTQILTDVEEY